LLEEFLEGVVGSVAVGVCAEVDSEQWEAVYFEFCFESDVAFPRSDDGLDADQVISVDLDRRVTRRIRHPKQSHGGIVWQHGQRRMYCAK
jgi:hypothetical protein